MIPQTRKRIRYAFHLTAFVVPGWVANSKQPLPEQSASRIDAVSIQESEIKQTAESISTRPAIDTAVITASLPWLLDTLGLDWKDARVRSFIVSNDNRFVALDIAGTSGGSAYRFLICDPFNRKILYPEVGLLRKKELGFPSVRVGFDSLSTRAAIIVGYRSLMARLIALPEGKVVREDELTNVYEQEQMDSVITELTGVME